MIDDIHLDNLSYKTTHENPNVLFIVAESPAKGCRAPVEARTAAAAGPCPVSSLTTSIKLYRKARARLEIKRAPD